MKTFRIEIIDEETNEVVQKASGIPEQKMRALLQALGQFGQLAGDLSTIKNALGRVFGRRNP